MNLKGSSWRCRLKHWAGSDSDQLRLSQWLLVGFNQIICVCVQIKEELAVFPWCWRNNCLCSRRRPVRCWLMFAGGGGVEMNPRFSFWSSLFPALLLLLLFLLPFAPAPALHPLPSVPAILTCTPPPLGRQQNRNWLVARIKNRRPVVMATPTMSCCLI